MGSILGRGSEEIAGLEAQIRAALESTPDAQLRSTLRGLFDQLEAARESYWQRARELHVLREALREPDAPAARVGWGTGETS